MIRTVLIKNANLVNEGKVFNGDLLIEGDRIADISESISSKSSNTLVIEADGLFLLPGMIDDQVHFREPGLTHKATIETESKAAVAGGLPLLSKCPIPFRRQPLSNCWKKNFQGQQKRPGLTIRSCLVVLTTIWRKS